VNTNQNTGKLELIGAVSPNFKVSMNINKEPG